MPPKANTPAPSAADLKTKRRDQEKARAKDRAARSIPHKATFETVRDTLAALGTEAQALQDPANLDGLPLTKALGLVQRLTRLADGIERVQKALKLEPSPEPVVVAPAPAAAPAAPAPAPQAPPVDVTPAPEAKAS